MKSITGNNLSSVSAIAILVCVVLSVCPAAAQTALPASGGSMIISVPNYNLIIQERGIFDSNLGPHSIQVWHLLVEAINPAVQPFSAFEIQVLADPEGLGLYQVGERNWVTMPPPGRWSYTYTPNFEAANQMNWSHYDGYPNYAAYDTHFLIPNSHMIVLEPPSEDNDFSLGLNSSGMYSEGFGTFLRATAGIDPQHQQTVTPLLQISVPVGEVPIMTGSLAGSGELILGPLTPPLIPVWVLDDNGEWNPAVSDPWKDGFVPHQAGDTAIFSADSASDYRTITLTHDIKIGQMSVHNAPGVTRTFTGSQLTFDNLGDGASLTCNPGAALVIESNVRLDDALTIGGAGAISISGNLSGGGHLTKTGTGTLTLSGNLSSSFEGDFLINGGTVRLGSTNSLPKWNTYINTGGTLDLGGFNFAWRDGRVYLAGGSLINSVAGTTSSLNREVSLGAPSTIGGDGNVTFQSTFTGGSHTLTKTGAGQAQFSGLAAGDLNITAGSVRATTANVGVVTMGAGTSLNVTGVPFVPKGLVSTHTDATVNIGGAAMSMDVSGTHDFAGVITGAGQMLKLGGGTQRLSGDSTFTGAIRIGGTNNIGGTLQFTSIGNVGAGPSSLGNPTTAANATIDIRSGTLQYVGDTPAVSNRPIKATVASVTLGVTAGVSVAAGSELELTGPITIEANMLSLNAAGSLIISGDISGVGGVHVFGSGVQLLGDNTYTGGTRVGGMTSPGTSTLTIERFGSHGEAVTPLGAATTRAQSDIVVGDARLQYVGAGETVNRNIVQNRQSGVWLENAGTGVLNWAGYIVGGDTRLNLDGAGEGILSGQYRDDAKYWDAGEIGGWPLGRGGSRIDKHGEGTWALAGENSYHNLTRVYDGTLRVTANRALGFTCIFNLGSAWPVDSKTHVYDGGTLAFGGNVYYDGQLQYGTWGGADSTAPGRWTNTDVPVLDPITGEHVKLYQIVQIAGAGTAGRAGAIDSTDGNNTFTGPIQLTTEFYDWQINGTAGMIRQYAVADATIGASAGSLTLTGGINTTSTVSRLDGNVRYWMDIDVVNTLTLNPTGGNLIIADNGITGIGNVVKTGEGVATLLADSTYTGTTTVQQGTLRLLATSTSDTFIEAGGTLSGTGTIIGNLFNAGTLAPGAIAEAMTVDGDYTAAETARLLVSIAGLGQHYSMDVTGAAFATGFIDIAILGDYEPLIGDTFDILTAGGGVTADNLSVIGDGLWSWDVVGNTTLQLQFIPEPATLAMLALGGLAVLRRRRAGKR